MKTFLLSILFVTPLWAMDRHDGIDRTLERESHAQTIDAAIRIKESGLRYVRTIRDFSRLAVPANSNPSQGYREAIARFIVDNAHNYLRHADEIRNYVELEDRLTCIDQVIALKTNGLRVVQTLKDYVQLTDLGFYSPSTGMLQARSRFIGQNVNQVFATEYEVEQYFPELETRCTSITDTIELRNGLLRSIHSVEGFLVLAKNYFDSPSNGLRSTVSSWIVQNVHKVIQWNSDIGTILAIERQTYTINDAFAVKEAGLAAVRRPRQFWHLAEPAFANPTNGYLQAVDAFIRRYADMYGR